MVKHYMIAIVLLSAFVPANAQDGNARIDRLGFTATAEEIHEPGVVDWVTEPAKLLKLLKARDGKFENRTLDVEQKWTERVGPRGQLLAAQANARRFGQEPAALPPDDEIPDDFDQPHRVRHALTVRDVEVTLERLGEVAVMQHPQFVSLQNAGHRWSTVGGVERSYSPETNMLHLSDIQPAGVLRSNQWMFEWCCGYGIAKWMQSIEKASVQGRRLVVDGKLQLMGYDDSHVKMELDGDYMVRRAVLTVPVQIGEGSNQYVVTTTGTERPDDAPAVAKEGHFQRILQKKGKPDRVYKEYDVEFVALSAALTEKQYQQLTRIDPPENVRVLDQRARKK